MKRGSSSGCICCLNCSQADASGFLVRLSGISILWKRPRVWRKRFVPLLNKKIRKPDTFCRKAVGKERKKKPTAVGTTHIIFYSWLGLFWPDKNKQTNQKIKTKNPHTQQILWILWWNWNCTAANHSSRQFPTPFPVSSWDFFFLELKYKLLHNWTESEKIKLSRHEYTGIE